MKNNLRRESTIGVVGLGLMGSGFVVSLLISGHRVKAVAPLAEDMETAPDRIRVQLGQCAESGLLSAPVDSYLLQLDISTDYRILSTCHMVMECVIEIAEIKRSVYEEIEAVVEPESIIASNTSAIPISDLQKYFIHPGRFLGIHVGEPSYLTRFMEIICGRQTNPDYAMQVYELAHHWGKEPTLLRKDIRGFITNRLMYAVYREGLELIEKKKATLEDVDKAFRYDAGSWMTLMGIFRRIDLLGIKDYAEIFRTVFPELSNNETLPALMKQMVEMHAKGTRNLKGLYHYTEEEAKNWDDAFTLFNKDIYELAALYPSGAENLIRKTSKTGAG